MRNCLLLVLLACPMFAADSKVSPDPTMEDVLAQLDAQAATFRDTVPNFFCKEHVVSSFAQPGTANGKRSVIDSTFRLRREVKDNHLLLNESHTTQKIDGRTPTYEEEKLHGPAVLSGVFSNGLNFVSTAQQACYAYRLKVHRAKGEIHVITIDFRALPDGQRDPACGRAEIAEGRIEVDRDFHVVHSEKRTEKYEMSPGVPTVWKWSVDYRPVLLGEERFWMPATIQSSAVEDVAEMRQMMQGAFRRGGTQGMQGYGSEPSRWEFSAKYTDFHRVHVTSRILTGSPDVP